HPRLRPGPARAPPVGVARLDPGEDALLLRLLAEARSEGANEGKPDQPELDRSNDGHADPPVAVAAAVRRYLGPSGSRVRPTTIMPRSKHRSSTSPTASRHSEASAPSRSLRPA